MPDRGPPDVNAYLYAQLGDLKADIAAMGATLGAINDEMHANRDRFHRIAEGLQSVIIQLHPIYTAYPTMQKKLDDFTNLKNKGIGVIIAAGAAGALFIELFRLVWNFIGERS